MQGDMVSMRVKKEYYESAYDIFSLDWSLVDFFAVGML